MPTRRLLAAGLAAGAFAAPGIVRAQKSDMRRTVDPNVVMPAPGRRPWAEQVPQLRIGLMGGENETDRLARNEGYKRLLEETFQVPVRLFPASDYGGV
ncbi:MAG: phosphate/phosphite/phosphonate ABC transporter substrate-binding protein, partial [Acetobacteraceae bacterium]|nr:phosphate/phosphite/phosphonate ABC transporter substrate-binding protein [Acetobacteraceae bacterium]